VQLERPQGRREPPLGREAQGTPGQPGGCELEAESGQEWAGDRDRMLECPGREDPVQGKLSGLRRTPNASPHAANSSGALDPSMEDATDAVSMQTQHGLSRRITLREDVVGHLPRNL
jgi:hypothetical protein